MSRDAVLGGNSGGPGRDFVDGGPLRDEDQDGLAGGNGRDVVAAFIIPAATDAIDCGRGFDKVLVDSMDVTKNCERVFTNPSKFANSIPNYYFELLRRIP